MGYEDCPFLLRRLRVLVLVASSLDRPLHTKMENHFKKFLNVLQTQTLGRL
jgi:hypothetical protein